MTPNHMQLVEHVVPSSSALERIPVAGPWVTDLEARYVERSRRE